MKHNTDSGKECTQVPGTLPFQQGFPLTMAQMAALLQDEEEKEIQKCPTGKQIQEANHRRVNMLERKKLDTIQHSDDSLAQSTGSFEPRGQYSSFGMSD